MISATDLVYCISYNFTIGWCGFKVGKINRIITAAIPGTGSGVADTSCGTFYNPGDNRVRRAVSKENVAYLSVTSTSFTRSPGSVHQVHHAPLDTPYWGEAGEPAMEMKERMENLSFF
jgi:hypothetical protein